MKQTCYFSYCWDDPESIMDLMTYLKNEIEKRSNNSIQVIIDKKDFHVAENFKEKEKEKIEKSDSAVIFFSPSYRYIIDERIENRGVLREYEYILEALSQNNIAVIPIIIEGEVRKAITREFKDNIAADFSKFPPIIDGKKGKKLNPKYRTEMTNLISSVIYETSVAHRRKDYHFSNKEEAYTVLFCNTDSKNKLPRGCMYKSDAYKNIMSRDGTSFLVGRKGSGKTTFFEVLEKYNPAEFDKRFKVLRPISVEDIREEHLYSVMEKMDADHKIFGKSNILELFWEIYLNLCALYIVCVEEENFRIRDERKPIFHKVANKLKKVLMVSKLDSDDVKKAIFTVSVELWDHFINSDILDYATEESFLASMDANFNVDNILKQFLGKSNYSQLVRAIGKCDKEILIALDKFDSISDDFRRKIKDDLQNGSEDVKANARNRSEFDCLLYRSLVTTVEKLKLKNSNIMMKSSFCIIIPQDRVDQIKLVDRDFAKKNFMSLSWDAIELLEVVILRLKELYGFEINKDENIIDIFKDVMKKYMPTIPIDIKIEVGAQDKTIDIFQYLLRNSFWRPRDIIKYFAVLYDANEKNIDKHKQIDMVTLKNLLNDVTEDIINNEFYNEYDKIFYNIDDFMGRFEEGNIILPIRDFIDIILDFKFMGVIFDGENGIFEKIRMLYELGVIGIRFEKEYIKKNNIGNKLCFVFNEGLFPLERVKNELLRCTNRVEIVLNPIFSKRLSLNYNTSELIGAYGWEYLAANHIRKMGIRRI